MVAHDEWDVAAQTLFVQLTFTSARHIMSWMACSVYQIPPLPKPTSMVEALVLLAILSMKCGEHCPCLAKSPKSSRLHMARVGALWSSRTTIRDAAMQQHSPTWCCEWGARGTRELVEPAARALRMRRPSPLCPAPRSERKVARATSVNPRNVIH